MKRQMTLLIVLLLFSLSLPALADHSVLPAAGELNETQALNQAIAYLCEKENIREETIRGRWFFYSTYYEYARWLEGYEGTAWVVNLVDPDTPASYQSDQMVRDETNEQGWRWEKETLPAMLKYSIILNAKDGKLLEAEKSVFPMGDAAEAFWQPLVPQASQLQPQQALDRAYELLTQALQLPREEVRAAFRDYHMSAVSALGSTRCWYRIDLYAFGKMASNYAYHVYLDMDSGELVRKTDDRIIAGRFDLWRQGIHHDAWYQEQEAAQEAEWGKQETWDYLQNAAFEEKCYGYPFYVLNLATGLPREDECTLEEAEAAARKALARQTGSQEENWKLTGSLFWEDCWGDWEYRLARFDTGTERVWELTFENENGATKTVYLNPSTRETVDGFYG